MADVPDKIQRLIERGASISEDEMRSLMILVRKQTEFLNEDQIVDYLTLILFCNWCAHTAITHSRAGMRTLARINDVLVKVGQAKSEEVILQLSKAIGFGECHAQMRALLNGMGVKHNLENESVRRAFQHHLLEIIKDVPLKFPEIGRLSKGAREIYNEIARNPIKPGAGVTEITLSRVDYDAAGARGVGKIDCLVIQTEDKTKLVVPLEL